MKQVGPFVARGYLNAVYRLSHVLGKAARVRTNAMENQDDVDRPRVAQNANDATRRSHTAALTSDRQSVNGRMEVAALLVGTEAANPRQPVGGRGVVGC